jgi:putative ABC transport system ATP-binding protein
MANNPAIILADEPTGNLDQKTGLEIVKLLAKLKVDQGTTIIMVTHDNRMASKTERMLFINDGRLLGKEREGALSSDKNDVCPGCGRQIGPDDIFCPRCGTRL